MPTKAEVKRRGGVKRIRTKRLPDGTLLRIYVFNKRGSRGGRTQAERVKGQNGKAKSTRGRRTQTSSGKGRGAGRT